MNYDQFVGEVQRRANTHSEGDTVKAIRATLETLAERLKGGEPSNLASQLPQEIAFYMRTMGTGAGKQMSANEFVKKVAQREDADPDTARTHVQAVMSVLKEAVSPGEWRDMLDQLPSTYNKLFEAGGTYAAAGQANEHWQPQNWQSAGGGELF